jgi:hypothetical protein
MLVVAHGKEIAMPLTIGRMDTKILVRVLNLGRVVIGAAMVAAPEQVGPRMLGRIGRKPEAHFMMRLFGIRDLVLGAGTLVALGREGQARTWLMAGVAADAVDLASTLMARDSLPASSANATIAAAGSAILVGAGAAAALD